MHCSQKKSLKINDSQRVFSGHSAQNHFGDYFWESAQEIVLVKVYISSYCYFWFIISLCYCLLLKSFCLPLVRFVQILAYEVADIIAYSRFLSVGSGVTCRVQTPAISVQCCCFPCVTVYHAADDDSVNVGGRCCGRRRGQSAFKSEHVHSGGRDEAGRHGTVRLSVRQRWGHRMVPRRGSTQLRQQVSSTPSCRPVDCVDSLTFTHRTPHRCTYWLTYLWSIKQRS